MIKDEGGIFSNGVKSDNDEETGRIDLIIWLSLYQCTRWLLNVCVLAQPSPDNDEITAFYALESQCIIM